MVTVWQPNRNILVYAGDGEESVPYLQPMIFWNSFRNHEHNYQATRTRLINLKFLLAPYFRHVLAETWGLLLYRINI